MTTVLISAPYMIPVLDRFRSALEKQGITLLVPDVRERLEEGDLLGIAGQFDGAICGDDAYTRRVLEACSPRLKVISKWGTGVDSIDAEACARLGIQLFRTPNAFTTPVADSVMGYVLDFARRQPWMDREMKGGAWSKLPGRALSECTLGIVGVGNIGKAVTRRARAFGMRVLGNDIVEIDHVFISETGIEMMNLDSLLVQSDFISLHCDLNPSSLHLMDERTFARVRPGAILINTARGAIVEEKALVAALESGQLSGAALDVFEVEPLPRDSPLLKMSSVLLAPHNSNSSPQAWERVHQRTIQNLLAGLGLDKQGSVS
jgi:phosphoglycerate dehydrogenase-like enzyme